MLRIFNNRRKDEREREIRQLTKTVKKTMCSQDRKVKGISDIVFTVGREETDAFKAENESRRAQGESYFTRVKNDVGSKETMCVIWKRSTTERKEFITDLVLASTQPNSEHFFFGDREGYRLVVHPQMRGMTAADPSLCLWLKTESAESRFVADIRVSYTKDDHIDLARKNYEMMPHCLSKFNLGYANVWILWASHAILRLTDADHIEKELKDYSAMLSKNPDDKILAQMVDQAKWRLREAQMAEEDHARDIPGDDLTYTKNFLALKSKEVDKMCSIFRNSIDFDRDNRISIEDYCMFLREPLSMSPFIRQVFALSAPANGKLAKHPTSNSAPILDVGATLKATSVFCMLCSSDLLKFVFAWYDARGYGVIENSQFIDLLGLFHPRHCDDVVSRALKEVDLPVDGKMPFIRFEEVALKFPNLLYPAFRVQEKMRQMFFGPRWWKRKLAVYGEAKELLEQEKRVAQEKEERERKQRYEMSEEYEKEAIDIWEIKKRRRKKKRR